MQKYNLVLVHSFPTNSVLLKGLVDFMEDFFNVYFIDLPGFNNNVSPLKEISFENYASFVEKEISRLNLKQYWLGGISFGFLVVNSVPTDERCKGMLAIEPYLGARVLNWPWHRKLLNRLRIQLVCLTGAYKRTMRSKAFTNIFTKSGHHWKTIETMQETIDPETLFKTARLILGFNGNVELKPKPYICVLNVHDTTIKAGKVLPFFENHPDTLIIRTEAEHYPTEMSKEYFEKYFKKKGIERIQHFMKEHV